MNKLLSIQKAIARHHGFIVWNPYGYQGKAQQLHFYYFLDGQQHVVDNYGKHKARLLYDLDRRLAKILYTYENGVEDEDERSTYEEF